MKKRILLPVLGMISLMSVACEAAYPPHCSDVALRASDSIFNVNNPGAPVANVNQDLAYTGNDYNSETWTFTYQDSWGRSLGALKVLVTYEAPTGCFISRVEAL